MKGVETPSTHKQIIPNHKPITHTQSTDEQETVIRDEQGATSRGEQGVVQGEYNSKWAQHLVLLWKTPETFDFLEELDI